MRYVVLKVLIFLAVLLAVNGIFLPWAISNAILPLWAIILLVGGALAAFGIFLEFAIERITEKDDDTAKADS